jgi:putative ABC transport system permease protein
MTALNRKLLRELWRLRGQVIAVALVIGSGVAVLVMSLSTLEALNQTSAAYYERYRFAEVFASATRAPESVAQRIAQIPGVQFVQTRISRYANLDISGFAEPVIGRLTSIPDGGQSELNQLALRTGRWIRPDRQDEVILNEPFAQAHGLGIGDELNAVINGHRRTLTVVGTALSPEFIYALGPGALLPDDRRFGILWMTREALEAAYDLDGAFNDLSVTLLRGVAPEPVIEQIDPLLKPYGGISALPRAEQLSNWFLSNEMKQLKTMSTVLPAIFLAVAAFLTHMVLARLIATERAEIGLLKAFGYSNLEVGWYYIKLVMAIAVVGILLGWIVGAIFGHYNTQLYTDLFHFPLLIYRPSPATFVIAATISIGVAIAGALSAVRRVVTLPPAEAMQPPAPAAYRRSWFSGLRFSGWLDQPTRIALRQIGRWPIRSALTSVGIAAAVGLLLMALQWNDSIDYMIQTYYFDAQHQDITVGLAERQSLSVVHDFEHLPGVMAVEPMRIVGADFSNGTRKHRGSIVGLLDENRLQRIHDDTTGENLAVPSEGLMLGSRLADKLGVQVGDSVWVEILNGRRPEGAVPVAGIFDSLISMPAYMDLNALNRWLRVRPSVGYVNLLVDSNLKPALFAKLKTVPEVSAVMVRQAAIDTFHNTVGTNLMIFVSMFTGFACALGFGVTYNSARIALSERGRELATLRVLGFTRGEISYILLGEVMLLIFIALPTGCLLGWGLILVMAQAFDTELFRLPLVIEPSTYGIAVVFTLLATGASAALVRRRIDRLDLISVLKTRE